MQNTLLDVMKTELAPLLPTHAEVLLFGSRARGTEGEGSDWDVLILLDREGGSSWDDYDKIGYPVNMGFWKHGQDVNTIIQTKNEWKRKSFTPFYKNVMQDAITIV